MSKMNIGIVLIVVGMIGLVVSLVADLVGIGSYPGYNWAQIAGTVVGGIMVLIGGWLALKKRDK